MATPIRVIPTLQGEEARKFIEQAEWVEAHPGTDKKFSRNDVIRLRQYLREQNLAKKSLRSLLAHSNDSHTASLLASMTTKSHMSNNSSCVMPNVF